MSSGQGQFYLRSSVPVTVSFVYSPVNQVILAPCSYSAEGEGNASGVRNIITVAMEFFEYNGPIHVDFNIKLISSILSDLVITAPYQKVIHLQEKMVVTPILDLCSQ